MNRNRFDIVIIGAGQAGLSMGYYLQRHGKNFVLLDQGKEVGEVWKNRYESLHLFTSRMYSSLPGLGLEGDPYGFPTKDEMSDYMKRYAEKFTLPIQLHTMVLRVSRVEETFYIETNRGTYLADQVVVATGPFHKKRVPDFANNLNVGITQLHSSEYRNPSQLEKGNVLVVGGGNSGAQIAVELARTKETYLAVSKPLSYFPLTFWGKSVFWWFDKIGLLHAKSSSFVGKKVRGKGDPIFGHELRSAVKSGTIQVTPRVTDANGRQAFFADGTSMEVDNIIWATGFDSSYDWIHIEGVLDERKAAINNRGVSPVKGLYFLGLPWQSHRGSSLVLGVGKDASYLVHQLVG
ncbi:putative flavoprotein involved in K+ transport [Sporosarcina luteola]|nr:putative flavoprotein involved in K+ transport [Sporosarcina luteola]